MLFLTAFAACSKVEDNGLLSAPSDLQVEQVGQDHIRLTWTNASKSYDGVLIERASLHGGWEFSDLARTAKGVCSYDDRRHQGDDYYQYRFTTYRKGDNSKSVFATFRYYRLPPPTDFKGELTDDGYVLTWKDNCIGEDGYVVRRNKGGDSFADWKKLGPDAVTVTDHDVVSGIYEYEVYAYVGDYCSPSLRLQFDNTGTPRISVREVSASWRQAVVQFALSDDGGYPCEAGVCWRNDGKVGAIVNDNCYSFPGKIRTGDPYFASITGLEHGKIYSIRPWVKYDEKYQYYNEMTVSILDEPSALPAEWIDVTKEYRLLPSIKLYRTETSVTGRFVSAWYAIADMSGGKLELRTFVTPSPVIPSEAVSAIDGVNILVNGGFFNGTQSDSYVMDQGTEVCSGLRAVRCTYYADAMRNEVSRNYGVTRGAFGVDQNQIPSVKWIYGSRDWAYDVPMPAFNSGPLLQPTSTYPSYQQKWNVYSAIGGGPVILRDGNICIDYLTTVDKGGARRYVGNPELIGDDVFGKDVRTARTAIGHTQDGKIVLMVVDGNGAGGSQGVTLDELARLMKGVGCTDVLNLGGGDSSVMCSASKGKVLNVPSGGEEREMVSFVALTAR